MTIPLIEDAEEYNKLLAYTGKSPVDFIRNVKLEKAKALLELRQTLQRSDLSRTKNRCTTR